MIARRSRLPYPRLRHSLNVYCRATVIGFPE